MVGYAEPAGALTQKDGGKGRGLKSVLSGLLHLLCDLIYYQLSNSSLCLPVYFYIAALVVVAEPITQSAPIILMPVSSDIAGPASLESLGSQVSAAAGYQCW